MKKNFLFAIATLGLFSFAKQSSAQWQLTGNAGTNPTTDFVGTTDNKPLTFKVNGTLSGRVEQFTQLTMFGLNSGNTSITGINNTMYGANSGSSLTIGVSNNIFGVGAGNLTTSGSQNCFFGSDAGSQNKTGTNNTFFGYHSGNANVVSENSFFGSGSGENNSTGLHNTFIGTKAGFSNVGTGANTYIGYNAGLNAACTNSTFVGAEAGLSTTNGTQNTFIGRSAGKGNISGNQNVYVGDQAANANTTGSLNTVVGSLSATTLTSGIQNTFIGSTINAGTTRNNGIAIGHNVNLTADNCAVIGSNVITKWGFGITPVTANIIQFVSTTTTAKLTTGGVWTNASDRKLKDNIQQLDKKEILEKINNLEVARWHYKADKEMKTYIGPFAKDFYNAFKTGDDSTISTIDPSGVALIGIQQLSIENKELRKENEELKSRLDKIEALLSNNATSEALKFQKLVLESNGKVAVLGQNIPNPFNGKTIINYYLPQEVKSAQLVITTVNGLKLVTEQITNRGQGVLELDATKLASGNYYYTLITDDNKIDTKQFSLRK